MDDYVINLHTYNMCRKNWLKLLLSKGILGFPQSSVGKETACYVGDLDFIPGLGRSPGEGKGYPLQYFGLENSMACIVHGVAKSEIQLSNFHFQEDYKLRFTFACCTFTYSIYFPKWKSISL